MQDPLKQGLKQNVNVCSGSGVIIRMQDPLKQGLKPLVLGWSIRLFRIRMQDPLKQGLKLRDEPEAICTTFEFECKIH